MTMATEQKGSSAAALAPEDAVGLEMVKLGYATESPDPNCRARCLFFRAKFDTLAGAQAAVRAIGKYNNFDGEKIVTALESCDFEDIYGEWVEIGREYSPVLYIRSYGSEAEVMAAMRDAQADEVEVDKRGYVRAWWD